MSNHLTEEPPEVEGRALLSASRIIATPPTMHILCVEDDRISALKLQHWGQKLFDRLPGSMISFVGSMAAAEAYLRRDPPPDFMVLDLTLPDSTSEQTISRLDEFQERVPLIILTVESEANVTEMIERAKQRPVDVLQKEQVFVRHGFIWDLVFRIRREWTERRYLAQRAADEEKFSRMQVIIDTLYGHPSREGQ